MGLTVGGNTCIARANVVQGSVKHHQCWQLALTSSTLHLCHFGLAELSINDFSI